jgi:hypothetical protein
LDLSSTLIYEESLRQRDDRYPKQYQPYGRPTGWELFLNIGTISAEAISDQAIISGLTRIRLRPLTKIGRGVRAKEGKGEGKRKKEEGFLF